MSPARYVKGPSGFVEQGGGGTLFGSLVGISPGLAVTVNNDATAHTKGAWTELIASTAEDATWLSIKGWFNVANNNATDTRTLVDIGIGASGAETVIIPNVSINLQTEEGGGYLFPVQVPAGSRVAARSQGVNTHRTFVALSISAYSGGSGASPTEIDALNLDVAASTAVSMLSTADTWVEMIASTSRSYQAIVVVPCGTANAAANYSDVNVQLGIGASGSEVTVDSWEWLGKTTEVWRPNNSQLAAGMYIGSVPAGSRIAVKTQYNLPNQSVALYGVPA